MKETKPDKARVHLRAECYGANATAYTIPSSPKASSTFQPQSPPVHMLSQRK